MATTGFTMINNEMMEPSDDDSILSDYSLPDYSELAASNQEVDSLLTRSQYAMVVFHDIAESYPNDSNLVCRYTLTDGVQATPGDRVVLFLVGWTSVQDYVAFEWAPTPKNGENDLEISFQAAVLPQDNEFYQVCYVSNEGAVCGASVPFQVRQPNNEELTYAMEDDMVVERSLKAQNNPPTTHLLRAEKKKLLKALQNALSNALSKPKPKSKLAERETEKLEAKSAESLEKAEKQARQDEKLVESRDEMAINVAETEWLLTVTDEMAEDKQKLCRSEMRVKELQNALANAESEYEKLKNIIEVEKKQDYRVIAHLQDAGEKNVRSVDAFEDRAESCVMSSDDVRKEVFALNLLLAEERLAGKELQLQIENYKEDIARISKESEILAKNVQKNAMYYYDWRNCLSRVKESECEIYELRLKLAETEYINQRQTAELKALKNPPDERTQEKTPLEAVNQQQAEEFKRSDDSPSERKTCCSTEDCERMKTERFDLKARIHWLEILNLQLLKMGEYSKDDKTISELEKSTRIAELEFLNRQLLADQKVTRVLLSEVTFSDEGFAPSKQLKKMFGRLWAGFQVLMQDYKLGRNFWEKSVLFDKTAGHDNEILTEMQLAYVARFEELHLQMMEGFKLLRDSQSEEKLQSTFGKIGVCNMGSLEDSEMSREGDIEEEDDYEAFVEERGQKQELGNFGKKNDDKETEGKQLSSWKLLENKDRIPKEARARISMLEALNLEKLRVLKSAQRKVTKVKERKQARIAEAFLGNLLRAEIAQFEALNLDLLKDLEISQRVLPEKSTKDELQSTGSRPEILNLSEDEDYSQEKTASGNLQAEIPQLEALNLSKDFEASQRLLSEKGDFNDVKTRKGELQSTGAQLEIQSLNLSKDLEASVHLPSEEEHCSQVTTESGNLRAKIAQLEALNLNLSEDYNDVKTRKEELQSTVARLETQNLNLSKDLEATLRLLSEKEHCSQVTTESENLRAKITQLEARNRKLLDDLKTSQCLRTEREVCVISEDCYGDKTAENLKNENRRLRETLEDMQLTVSALEYEKLTLQQLLDDNLGVQKINAMVNEQLLREQNVLQSGASGGISQMDFVDLESKMAFLEDDLDLALRSNVAEAEARAALELENASMRTNLAEIKKVVEDLTKENQELRSKLSDISEQTSEENEGHTVRILLKELAVRNKDMESLAMDIQKERSNFTSEIERLKLENEDLAARNILLVKQEVKGGEAMNEIQRLTFMHEELLNQNAKLSHKLQQSTVSANEKQEQQDRIQEELSAAKDENESMKKTLKATQEQLNSTWEEMKKIQCQLDEEKDKNKSMEAKIASELLTKDSRLLTLSSQNQVILNKLTELDAKLEKKSCQGESEKIDLPRLLEVSERIESTRKKLDSVDSSLRHMSNVGVSSEQELRTRLERAGEEYRKVYSEMVHYKEKYSSLKARMEDAKKAAAVFSEGEKEKDASWSKEKKTRREGIDKKSQWSASQRSTTNATTRQQVLRSIGQSAFDGSWGANGRESRTFDGDNNPFYTRRESAWAPPVRGIRLSRTASGNGSSSQTVDGDKATVELNKYWDKYSLEQRKQPMRYLEGRMGD